jgi:hypothetical protein
MDVSPSSVPFQCLSYQQKQHSQLINLWGGNSISTIEALYGNRSLESMQFYLGIFVYWMEK